MSAREPKSVRNRVHPGKSSDIIKGRKPLILKKGSPTAKKFRIHQGRQIAEIEMDKRIVLFTLSLIEGESNAKNRSNPGRKKRVLLRVSQQSPNIPPRRSGRRVPTFASNRKTPSDKHRKKGSLSPCRLESRR
jgi:hypothetical protein